MRNSAYNSALLSKIQVTKRRKFRLLVITEYKKNDAKISFQCIRNSGELLSLYQADTLVCDTQRHNQLEQHSDLLS